MATTRNRSGGRRPQTKGVSNDSETIVESLSQETTPAKRKQNETESPPPRPAKRTREGNATDGLFDKTDDEAASSETIISDEGDSQDQVHDETQGQDNTNVVNFEELSMLQGMGLYVNAERTAQQGAVQLHHLLTPDLWDIIDPIHTQFGRRGDLENISAIEPKSGYHVVSEYFCAPDSKIPLRVFTVGVVNIASDFYSGSRRRINIIPSERTWGRATGVIGSVFGLREAHVYSYKGGLSFSTIGAAGGSSTSFPMSPAFTSPTAKPKAKEKPTKAIDDNIHNFNWPIKGALSPGDTIRVFDGRNIDHDFDITHYRSLPIFTEEIPAATVVAVVFTINRYVDASSLRTNLSFNLNELVVLTDSVHDRPSQDEIPDNVQDFPFTPFYIK